MRLNEAVNLAAGNMFEAKQIWLCFRIYYLLLWVVIRLTRSCAVAYLSHNNNSIIGKWFAQWHITLAFQLLFWKWLICLLSHVLISDSKPFVSLHSHLAPKQKMSTWCCSNLKCIHFSVANVELLWAFSTFTFSTFTFSFRMIISVGTNTYKPTQMKKTKCSSLSQLNFMWNTN